MTKINMYDTIVGPVITEKSTNLSGLNKIVFKVHKNANKKNIKSNARRFSRQDC